MGKTKVLGIVLIIAGIAIAIIFATADLIGLGGHPSFGPLQIIGTVGGAIGFLIGLILTFRKTGQ